MPRVNKTSVRLDDETERQLAALAAWLGVSQASVIAMSIRKLYTREAKDHPEKIPDKGVDE